MKKIFTLLLLAGLFSFQLLHAVEENNPPKCPPHDYGDSLYECNISGSVTTTTEQRTASCSTTPSTATSMGNSSVSVNGQCLEYCICQDCSDRLDKGSAYVGKTASMDNPDTEANGTLKPGWHSVDVRIECHTVRHVYPGIYIEPHNHLLSTPGQVIACYMNAEPAYSSYISYVQYKQDLEIPVGSTYRFGVSWLSPESPATRAGKNIISSYYCPICNNTWSFPEGSEKIASHHEKFPDPQTTGEEIIGEYYPFEVKFPNISSYGVSFTKECESYEYTFPGWNPQDITIGGCSPYTYTFSLNTVGVESLTSPASPPNFYDAGDNHWYILSHIDADAGPPVIIGRESILNLDATADGPAWPTINPYYNVIYDYDPLDPDKGIVKYPKWSCSPPAYYTQPDNYEFYCGNTPPTDVNGYDSVSFKGKSYGLYTISAYCGTDVHQGADPDNNIARKTKWVHVIDPKVDVEVALPLPEVVSGNASESNPPIKAITLKCGEDTFVRVDLDFIKNGTDIGDLSLSIIPERLYPGWDLPEYELYADSAHTVPLTQTAVSVNETNTEHQLYSLANSGAKSIYILMKTPGYITTRLSYKLGSYIDEESSDKFMALPSPCSGGTCTMPNPTAYVDSVDYRFNLGSSAFGKAGGLFQVRADSLTKELFSLGSLNIIIGPTSSVTYDANHDGYPTLIDTGLYKTAFTYERDTIGSETFVKKITAQYSQSGSSTVLSTIVMEITYDAQGVVSAFNTSYTKHVTGGDIVQNWSYSQIDATCPDLGVTKTFWILNDDGVNNYVTYDVVGNLKTEYRYISSITSPSEKIITVQQLFDWGYETVSETKHGLTTAYEYYTNEWGGRQGWVKKITYPRGNSTEYFYDTSGRVTRELTLEGGATKETLYTYTDSLNKTQTIRKYNTTIVSKTEDVSYHNDYTNPDVHTEYDESDNTLVTTTYKINNSSSEYHGKTRLVKRPDETVTVTEYAKANDEETITTYDGVPNDFSSTTPTVTDGIKSVYRTNSAGQMIYSATWDIATSTKLSEQTAITTDSFGRVTKYQYMDGTYSESTYGCCGVDWEKDRNGAETTYAYNDNGSLNYSVRNGITTLYLYDDLRNVVSTTVKGRNDTELTSTRVYTNGVLTSTTDPMNYTTAYSNNGDTVTYPNNTTSTTVYTSGVVTGTSGTAVHAQTYSYGPNWQKTMPQDVTVYTDMLGRQYKTVYADNTYTETFYNSKGQAVKQVSPAGRITLTEYDSRGRVYRSAVDMNQNSVIDGDDEITQYNYYYYTRDGKTVYAILTRRIVGAYGRIISNTETTLNGMESWTAPSYFDLTTPTHTLTERLGSGELKTTVTYPNGSKTITYSTYGLTTKIEKYGLDGTTADNVTEYVYDEFDRLTTVTEKYGTTVINEVVNSNFNANGQPQAVTTNGQATTYVYDNMGRRTSMTLPGSRTITYTYKDTGELDTVDGADTYKKEFDYDTQGRMSTFTTYKDASTPQVTTQGYNSRGFMTSKTYEDDNATTYTYNNDGQVATRVWDRGITTTYGYDNAGRKLTIDYSDSTTDITYTYDWMGNISTVTDAEGTRTFTYDYTNLRYPELVSVTIPSIINYSVNYTYDSYGRQTEMSLKNGSTPVFTNTYAYNSVTGRIATVGDGTYTANYTWQNGTGLMTQNQITRDSDSAVMTTHNRTYDTRTNNYHLLTTSNTTGSTTRTYTYVYNTKDQRTKLTLPDGSYWDYTYDSKGQVVSGIKYDVNNNPISGQYFGYDYDMIGNRVWEKDGSSTNQIDYTTNLVNQYTQLQPPLPAPAQSLTYDTDGNTLTSNGWNNTWNGENRLIETYNDTAGQKIEFEYDYMGRRISKKVYTGTSGTGWTLSTHQKFVYNGYKQIAEFDSSNNLQKTYTWQPVGLDVPLWVNDSSNYYYYIVDGNKNVREMVDTSGNLVASYDYNPFGKITASGTYASTNKFRFSSEYHDDETALVYYNYRYYDPELGRWWNRDPIAEKGGYNLYGMVHNNAISFWDKLGLELSGSQCECAYYRAIKIFNKVLDNFPPDQPLNVMANGIHGFRTLLFNEHRHDCAWGTFRLHKEMAKDKYVREAFRMERKRKGKFLDIYPPLGIIRNGKHEQYRFVRMHSILQLKGMNGCEKYFNDTLAFDYLKMSVYKYSKYDEEFYLDVQYDSAGYYEVKSSDNDILVENQSEPSDIALEKAIELFWKLVSING